MTDNSNSNNGTTGAATTEDRDVRVIEPADVEQLGLEAGDGIGRRIETFISPRSFVTQEWCLQHVAAQPRGYHVPIGRIAGVATTCERVESRAPVKPGDKPMPASVWIRGEFECAVLDTGEIKTASVLILPRAAGDLIEQAFALGGERILLDLELGVEATGRTIPYTYTVTAYGSRESESQRMVRAIRARQDARQRQRQLAAPKPTPTTIDA